MYTFTEFIKDLQNIENELSEPCFDMSVNENEEAIELDSDMLSVWEDR